MLYGWLSVTQARLQFKKQKFLHLKQPKTTNCSETNLRDAEQTFIILLPIATKTSFSLVGRGLPQTPHSSWLLCLTSTAESSKFDKLSNHKT